MASTDTAAATVNVVAAAGGQPAPPTKCIKTKEDIEIWRQTEAHERIVHFVLTLNDAIKRRRLTEPTQVAEPIQRAVGIIDQLESWLSEYPPVVQNSRFGNQAYRSWWNRLAQESPQIMRSLLDSVDPTLPDWIVHELVAYFLDAFGNATRIDYGSGHELHFAAWMCCLALVGVFKLDRDAYALVSRLFNRYLVFMRKLQRYYMQEPAGSHGVWGLDDYQFLPFLWGSAQLIDHDFILPSSIHKNKILEEYANDYLYLSCIKIIKEWKTGPFGEHSPMLNDVSGVATWAKINSGMIKMYHAEVLEKHVVIQHFLLGELLPYRPVQSRQKQQQ